MATPPIETAFTAIKRSGNKIILISPLVVDRENVASTSGGVNDKAWFFNAKREYLMKKVASTEGRLSSGALIRGVAVNDKRVGR